MQSFQWFSNLGPRVINVYSQRTKRPGEQIAYILHDDSTAFAEVASEDTEGSASGTWFTKFRPIVIQRRRQTAHKKQSCSQSANAQQAAEASLPRNALNFGGDQPAAWWGFASAMDKQRINAFLRRRLRSGLCPTDVSTFEELIDSQDEQLFYAIMANQNHVLHQLLPPLSDASQRYTLRPRAHNRQLPDYTRLTFVSLILLID